MVEEYCPISIPPIDRRPYVRLSRFAVGSWLLRPASVTVSTGYRVPASSDRHWRLGGNLLAADGGLRLPGAAFATRRHLPRDQRCRRVSFLIIFRPASGEVRRDTMALCFICNSKLYGERTRVCSSVTPYTNSPYSDKICELLGEEFVVIVTPADHMCKRCTSLLIHTDKLENDLKLVKNAMISYVQKKYGLLPADQPVKSIEVVNGNLKTDDLEVGQRKVPSGLTVREPSTSAGASSSNASSKVRQESSKMKIYKCGFCSFQSKDLGHVRFHMRSHMKKNNDKTNQTLTKTAVTQQQPQQQHQPDQQRDLQNKQQPYKQPQQQKKRLYRCQVCSASFDTRADCLEHIHKDHNQQQPVAEERETEVPLEETVAAFQPNSVENQQATVKNDEGHLMDGNETAINNTDLDMYESSEVPAQETQNISDHTSELLQVDHEISGTNVDIGAGTNVDIGDMAIGGNETETDNLDIESMLAAIHNDVSPPNDGGNPQNLL